MAASDAGLVLAGGAAIATLLALAAATAAWSARAATARRLRQDIDGSRARIDDLQRRRAAGEISAAEFDDLERGVATGLLEAGSAAAPRAKANARWARLALAAVVVAAATGALHAWLDHPGGAVVAGASAGASAVAAAGSDGAGKPRSAHPLSDEQLQRMVEQSRARVQKDPKDAAAWAMLAHSDDMLGRFAESSKSYATLARLVPGDAQVLADYADALAVANGRTLAGEPTALVRRALAIDPRNVKALTLAGTAAFERHDNAEAIEQWQKARALSADPRFIAQIDASLADARAAARGLPASAAALAAAPGPAGGASAVVAGRLSLADDLQAQAPPDATVFIFALPADGSRMPVAVTRRHVRDLPLDFALDDSMSMVRDVRLSQASAVVIGARISRRGDILPQAGDMQGLSAPVNVGTRGVKLEISEVLK